MVQSKTLWKCAGVVKAKKKAEIQTALLPTPLPPVQVFRQTTKILKQKSKVFSEFIKKHQNYFQNTKLAAGHKTIAYTNTRGGDGSYKFG